MIELKVQYDGLRETESLNDAIRGHVENLKKICEQIMSCHVVISRPHQKQHQGGIFHVKIRLHIPGSQIIIDRERGLNHAHEDVYVAIRDAFFAAKRKVDEFIRVRHGIVKQKEGPPHAIVRRILSGQDYGFLLTSDDREIYFHRNSLINGDFDTLEIGQEVRFSEEMGEKGPQATSVHLIGSSGHHQFLQAFQ